MITTKQTSSCITPTSSESVLSTFSTEATTEWSIICAVSCSIAESFVTNVLPNCSLLSIFFYICINKTQLHVPNGATRNQTSFLHCSIHRIASLMTWRYCWKCCCPYYWTPSIVWKLFASLAQYPIHHRSNLNKNTLLRQVPLWEKAQPQIGL